MVQGRISFINGSMATTAHGALRGGSRGVPTSGQRPAVSIAKLQSPSLPTPQFSYEPFVSSRSAPRFFAPYFTTFYNILRSPKSRPRRLPRRIWEPEPAQTPKMTAKWNPRPSKMVPQTVYFELILVLILVIFRGFIY